MEGGVVVHQEMGEETQGEGKRKPTARAGLWCMTRGGGEIEGDRQTTAKAGLWCMTRGGGRQSDHSKGRVVVHNEGCDLDCTLWHRKRMVLVGQKCGVFG